MRGCKGHCTQPTTHAACILLPCMYKALRTLNAASAGSLLEPRLHSLVPLAEALLEPDSCTRIRSTRQHNLADLVCRPTGTHCLKLSQLHKLLQANCCDGRHSCLSAPPVSRSPFSGLSEPWTTLRPTWSFMTKGSECDQGDNRYVSLG